MTKRKQKGDRFDALLHHVVHSAPVPPPPKDFALSMAKMVRDQDEDAGIETWLTNAVVIVAIIAVSGLAIYSTGAAASRVFNILGDVPWPLIFTAGAIFAGIKLLEHAKLPIRRSLYRQ
jgi:hypothetical protein